MGRLLAVLLFVALLLTGCPKAETSPCDDHNGIQKIEDFYKGKSPSGKWLCSDGHEEIWEDGSKTVG